MTGQTQNGQTPAGAPAGEGDRGRQDGGGQGGLAIGLPTGEEATSWVEAAGELLLPAVADRCDGGRLTHTLQHALRAGVGSHDEPQSINLTLSARQSLNLLSHCHNPNKCGSMRWKRISSVWAGRHAGDGSATRLCGSNVAGGPAPAVCENNKNTV